MVKIPTVGAIGLVGVGGFLTPHHEHGHQEFGVAPAYELGSSIRTTQGLPARSLALPSLSFLGAPSTSSAR